MINGEVHANREMALESVQDGIVRKLLELRRMVG